MKKLIMMSIFALGTITASASNDLFKNYYGAKEDQRPIFEFRYNYKFTVYRIPQGGGALIPLMVRNESCITPTQAEVVANELRMIYFPEIVAVDGNPLNLCTLGGL